MYRGRRRRGGRLRIVLPVAAALLIVGVGAFFAVRFAFQTAEPEPPSPPQGPSAQEILERADKLAAQYDYDGAIALVREYAGYEGEPQLTEAVSRYEAVKATLVPADISEIPHVFFHSLINDPAKVFDGDYKQDDYNQVMTTVGEFNKIMQQMYDRGYVLVSVHDMAQLGKGEDGGDKMTAGKIMLPPGKKPFVLSQDDLSYYEYMMDDGYPNRLVIDEEGRVVNEIDRPDGTVERGAFDVVPLLDAFVEEHPDFSYRGRKGIIALTGYNGILGYRTSDRVYGPGGTGDWENANLEADKAKAKAVADAMRANGWEFASHSWGHINYGSAKDEGFKRDADLWLKEVSPLIGETDVIIFPFGSDVGDWHPYTGERYQYLKDQGFRYFCNVDGSKYAWVQLTGDYLRQGRMNLDGYRMYQDLVNGKTKCAPFFDVASVFDPVRPLPVPDM